MLNNSGESGHPCLVPDLRGNAFSFSPLRIMFAVDLSPYKNSTLLFKNHLVDKMDSSKTYPLREASISHRPSTD